LRQFFKVAAVKIRNDVRALGFERTVAYKEDVLSSHYGADYYRARAMEMMEKAQEAPTKATRLAYLNLAHKWTEEAERLEATAPPQIPTPETGKRDGA